MVLVFAESLEVFGCNVEQILRRIEVCGAWRSAGLTSFFIVVFLVVAEEKNNNIAEPAQSEHLHTRIAKECFEMFLLFCTD
jgi:hypothetical protein